MPEAATPARASFGARVCRVVPLIMDHLLFKLVATPLLLAAATLAARRWGEAIGGLLVGLPLTSGPVSVFLALEHGPAFAAHATAGSLVATAGQAAFCIAYCRLAKRGWPTALAGAAAAFSVVAFLLKASALPETGLFLIAILAVALVLSIVPAIPVKAARLDPPRWDLPLRMALIAGLVVGVTMIAPYVGPETSGVLASFPFMVIILAVFAHRMSGAVAAQQLMRGMATGLLGFAAFFHVLSLTLTRLDLVPAYGLAIVCTLAIQAVSLYRMHVPVAMPTE
ncbi:membrane protein [Burkholderia lata]|uniref:Membrane protein n=2 Tax=Burkholderia lata (strain ATCC 17760 / DSM 23089 / LMG 22485 / NCIMB 9086 / R18194 / 383) TaxID=482957 RepID=A0A6P2M8G7_BURL3|nr:membrane protein [Burkholderia lata]VWB79642.1 membrane protein [Burkholderia lata]